MNKRGFQSVWMPVEPPLRSPGFPVELGGFGVLHAPFFTERRTRGSLQCYVAGNPGSLQSKMFPSVATLMVMVTDWLKAVPFNRSG